MTTRRDFLFSGGAVGAAAVLTDLARASSRSVARDLRRGPAGGARGFVPVAVPSGSKAPVRDVDGAKVYHLVAEEYEHAFAPGLVARCWGYNRMVNGHVLEAVEGDRVRIYVTNRLPAPTTTHWHGLILPNGMDGVSGLTQPPIPPGETWVYEFALVQNGTHMFHSHHDTMTQEGLGLTGMFVIHPETPFEPKADRDFALMLHEWRIDAGARRPNPNEMSDFNVLTMNGRVFPFIAPLVARKGQRVRIRLGNLSAMDHHPIHLHGYEFDETAIDGARLSGAQRRRRVTTLVGVGETRDIEFDAVNVGDWAMHCHMTHHVMNQMGHEFPNMIGFDRSEFDRHVRALLPGYMTMGTKGMNDMTDSGMPIPDNSIPMARAEGRFGSPISLGGMANVLKVREDLTDAQLDANEDPGWYEHPAGSVVGHASAEQMRRDGIETRLGG